MRRTLATLLATAVVVAASAGPAAAGEAHHKRHPKRPPAHLLVYAQEWSLWPSRASVPAGTVFVELWNRGQDQHDLRIRRLNRTGQMVGPVVGRVGVTNSGAISHATWHLRVGRYELYCSMPGHMARGMHTTLRVTKR